MTLPKMLTGGIGAPARRRHGAEVECVRLSIWGIPEYDSTMPVFYEVSF